MQIWSGEIKDVEKLFEFYKGRMPELEKELEHLIKTDDPNVIMLYSRRCMEVIITDLCECELKRPRKTEPLKGIIDKLNKEEKVPSHIITSMDSLNNLSTFGTHPKDYDPEQVRPVLIFLTTILKWYSRYKNLEVSQLTGTRTKVKEIPSSEVESSGQDSGIILDYHGPVNPDTIELIISKYKQSKYYAGLDKSIGTKVYAILVEIIENMSRYSLKSSGDLIVSDPYLFVRKQDAEIIITAGNPVSEKGRNELTNLLEKISKLNGDSLKTLYNEKISKELRGGERSAGLGFVIMALRSENRIKYKFRSIENGYSIFEIQVSVADFSIKKLIIEPTASSPKVIFDSDNNFFEISGESRPIDVVGFYSLILEWLDDYSKRSDRKSGTEPLLFNFCFEYFNSSSAKYIHDLFIKLSKMRSGGYNLIIKWYYKEDDEDMLEAGKEISKIAELPFDFIQMQT